MIPIERHGSREWAAWAWLVNRGYLWIVSRSVSTVSCGIYADRAERHPKDEKGSGSRNVESTTRRPRAYRHNCVTVVCTGAVREDGNALDITMVRSLWA